ncbi:uncharacterized protein CBL_12472 [Carabus blaptoides fortunei]
MTTSAKEDDAGETKQCVEFRARIRWPDLLVQLFIHLGCLYGVYLVLTSAKLFTTLWALLTIYTSGFALPVGVPCYFWNETLWNSFWLNFNGRFCITLNIAFFVNSVAHMWGNKPYDQAISPVENLAVSLAALGEGWHNYHHVFPWDYKTSELGNGRYNPTTHFIDFFARIGWAYDRKSVSPEMVARRAERSGDGTHTAVWGYGDKDIEPDDIDELDAMSQEKEKSV